MRRDPLLRAKARFACLPQAGQDDSVLAGSTDWDAENDAAPGIQAGSNKADAYAVYTMPMEAKALMEPRPSATPRTIPARTSLRKCMPRTIREIAMFSARNSRTPSSDG